MYKKIFYYSILLMFGILWARESYAATFSFAPTKSHVGVGDEIEIQVVLNPGHDVVNALEGAIIFPKEDFLIKDVRDGGSLVNMWVERPTIRDNRVSFSGIIPAGYNGKPAKLFSIIARSLRASEGSIKVSSMRVLANDGKGSRVPASTDMFSYSIFGKGSQEIAVPNDTEPPESFQIHVAQDANMFDGQYFAVFTTDDKLSGIDHFEIKEGFLVRFRRAESPYVLTNQKLTDAIYVKAIDRAGNERIVTLSAPHPKPWYKEYVVWGIIGLLALLWLYRVLFVTKKIWRHEM